MRVFLFNIFNFIVGGEVSVAKIHFLSVSLANVSLYLNTFYNILIQSIIVNCTKVFNQIIIALVTVQLQIH